MVTIYNVATGEPKALDMVDAREHVASGRWGFSPPEPVPVVDTTSAEPVPVVDTTSAEPVPVVDTTSAEPVPVVDTTSAEAYDERLEAFNAAMQVAASSPQAQTHPQVQARKAKK